MIGYKPTILIVDDYAANIAILSDLLKEDYHIKVAISGERAIEIASADKKIDLILLDIEMPNMDGYEVCKHLKNNPNTNGIPIIFVTARTDTDDEAHGLSLGAVDYITKPFHPMIIKMRVKNHIALKLKSDMLETLSMHDGLTHIPNRRYFDEVFEREFAQSKRDASAIALMMIDVDYFKAYNDNYGHGMGDDCLVKIAGALQASLKRGSDMVARYGGEEFVVIIKNPTHQESLDIAQKLKNAVSELKISHGYSSINHNVSVSIGLAYAESGMYQTKEELLKHADDALYRAKSNGRNCVME